MPVKPRRTLNTRCTKAEYFSDKRSNSCLTSSIRSISHLSVEPHPHCHVRITLHSCYRRSNAASYGFLTRQAEREYAARLAAATEADKSAWEAEAASIKAECAAKERQYITEQSAELRELRRLIQVSSIQGL